MLTEVHPRSLRWQLFIICPLKFSFMNCIPAALDTSLLFINAENHANDVDRSSTQLNPMSNAPAVRDGQKQPLFPHVIGPGT